MVRARAGRSAVALLVGALVSCEPQVTEVSLGDSDFDYAFAVFLSDAGDPLRVGPVFGRQGADTFGATTLPLDGDEARVLLVTLTQAQLTAAVDDFDPQRAVELAVVLDPPPARPSFLALGLNVPLFKRTSLPVQAGYFVSPLDGETRDLSSLAALDEPDPRARGAITMIVPVDPRRCGRPTQTPLRPFARQLNPITALGTPNPAAVAVQDLMWLDQDTALVVGYRELFVVRRGESWAASPETMYVEPTGNGARFRRFHEGVVVPAADGDDVRVAWIAGGFPGEAEEGNLRVGAMGRLWRVELEGGAIRSVQTATDTPGHQLWTVEVDPDGAVLVGGDGGLLLYKASDSDRFVRWRDLEVRRPAPGRDWVSALRFVGASSGTWVAGTMSILHAYDASQQRWEPESVIQDIVVSSDLFEFFGLDGRVQAGGRLELWASASRGGIIRRIGEDGVWTRLQPTFPPAFSPCAAATSPEDPVLRSQRAIKDIAVQDGYVHLLYQNCTAVPVIRLSRDTEPVDPLACVSLLAPDGETPSYFPGEYTALAARQGELLVLRGDGAIFTTSWSSSDRDGD